MRHRQPHQGAHVSTEPEKAGVSIGEQFPPSSGGGGGGGVALQSDLSNTATDEAWVFW